MKTGNKVDRWASLQLSATIMIAAQGLSAALVNNIAMHVLCSSLLFIILTVCSSLAIERLKEKGRKEQQKHMATDRVTLEGALKILADEALFEVSPVATKLDSNAERVAAKVLLDRFESIRAVKGDLFMARSEIRTGPYADTWIVGQDIDATIVLAHSEDAGIFVTDGSETSLLEEAETYSSIYELVATRARQYQRF
jgi:hypothetical protein